MDTCYYHPEAKARATCPDCGKLICDRCRVDGDMKRCAACVAHGPGGGVSAAQEVQSTVPGQNDTYEDPDCTTHAGLVADMQCMNCFRPFCLACVRTGYCADCAPAMGGKVARPDDYKPDANAKNFVSAYGETALESSYGATPAPTPGARPRSRPPQPGAAPAQRKGSVGKAPPPKRKGSPLPMVIGAIALILVAGGGYLASKREPAADLPFTGPTKVAISAPEAGGAPLSGNQVIALDVASPEAVEKVELTIDGKYWARFKEAPFESDWPTGVFKNGSHTIEAQATYRGGKTAKDSRSFTTKNKPLPSVAN